MKRTEFKKETRKKDLKALKRDLSSKEKAVIKEIIHESMREKKNPAQLKNTRLEIAVLKTIIKEKIIDEIK